MGTNFYFKIKVDLKIHTLATGLIRERIIEKLNDVLNNDTEIHIGKRSWGWKPLFEANEYFSNMEELLAFYKNNKDFLTIVNEYNEEFTIEQLRDELFDWNIFNNKAKTHIGLDGGFYRDKDGYEFVYNEFS